MSEVGAAWVPDRLAIYNERVKLVAGFINAVALGLVGFAVLRPLTEDLTSVGMRTMAWATAALAVHGGAHYVLSRLRKEADDDGL